MKPTPIGKTVYKVSDFLSWQRSGNLVLSPSFQRRPVWKKAAKSYLIDTVVRGLPIPIIFIRELPNLKTLVADREVVDGQQRLRTLLSFIDPSCLGKTFKEEHDAFAVLKLHNSEIAGKPFAALPASIRQQILGYEFSVHILPSDTDDKQVLQIFARLNSTGVRLKPQELRNAKFYGLFKTLMYELAYEQLERWRSWKIFTETEITRMDEVELTSELAQVILQGIRGKNQKELDDLYGTHDEAFPAQVEVARRFRATMAAIESLVGENLHELVFSRKTLFHTLFSFVYDIMYRLGSQLVKKAPQPLPVRLARGIRDASDQIANETLPEELADALRGATSHAGTRKTRLDFLSKVCKRAKAQ
jgi:hypothetical protein